MQIYRNRLAMILLLLAGSTTNSAIAQEAVATDAISAFKFDGIPLGTSIADFQRRFPKATVNAAQTDDKIGIRSYIVANAKGADGADFKFFKGRLYSIEVYYFWPRINNLGGIEAFAGRIRHQFGPEDDFREVDEEQSLIWNRPESARRAQMAVMKAGVGMAVIDTRTEAAVNDAKAAAGDIGF
jgi:hypothetical protein